MRNRFVVSKANPSEMRNAERETRSKRDNLTRREFVKSSVVGLATGALWTMGRSSARAQMPTPFVVEVHSDAVQREDLLDAALFRKMVEDGIAALTRRKTAQAGWKQLVAANDVVAIKVSASVPGLSTHHLLVDEVIRGLLSADVPPTSILIWDRFSEHLARFAYAPKPSPEFGFPEISAGKLVASEGTDTTIERVGYDESIYYESDADLPSRRRETGTLSLYSKIVASLATKIISLPALKVHPITGVSGTLSSLAFGSVNNTARFHPESARGMPMIADIWTKNVLREKHALTIVDGLTGAFHTGPGYASQWRWKANRLLFGTDPVALDAKILELLNKRRQEASPPLRPISELTGYIARAADLALGTNAASDIEHQTLEVS